MRLFSKTLLLILIGAGLAQAPRAEGRLDGFLNRSASSKPLLIDPEFAVVNVDQDASAGSYYGIALYDLTQKVASFVPQGSSENEFKASQEATDRRLRQMILQAKEANKDSTNPMKSYLLYFEGEVQVIEVKKDDPKALQSAVKEREDEAARLKYEASDEFKERMAARREIWDESEKLPGKSAH
jgi:hypothetical protein